MSSQVGPSEPLETSLTHDDPSSCEDEIVREYVKWMDFFGPNRRKYFESLGASLSLLTPSIETPPLWKRRKVKQDASSRNSGQWNSSRRRNLLISLKLAKCTIPSEIDCLVILL